jgi:hypothetical protein
VISGFICLSDYAFFGLLHHSCGCMHSSRNFKMLEVRTARRPALADISGGGFFMRTVESPGAVLVNGAVKRPARQFLSPSSNKENVPPVGAFRATPKRRTPLPDWYPRTPLRDITSIVKVVDYFLAIV